MKQRCLIALCLLVLSCTKDRDWNNPSDPGGIAEPTAPSGLKAVALNDSTIELTWQDSDGEMGYKIERSIDGGPMQEIGSVSQDHTRFADTGLKTDHEYRYRVRAFAANGEEAYAVGEKGGIDILRFYHVFPAPSNLVLTQVSDSEIRLEWKDNSAFESGFRIDRQDEGRSFSQVGLVGSSVTSYVDKGLYIGRTYTYRITAFTSINESAPMTQSIQLVFPAPSDLVLTQVSDSEIRLEWQDNSTFESGFAIERKEEGGDFTEVGSAGENEDSYTDHSTFYVGKTYMYRIKAITSINESASIEQSIQLVFPAPSDLVLTQVSDSEIHLEWKDNSAFESGFKIERKEGATSAYVQIATVGPNIQTYTDADVRLGTEYTYRVSAFTPSNESAALEASLQHVLQAPTNLKTTRLPGSSVRLSWVDKSPIEGGFIIERKEGAQGSYVEIGRVGANTTNYTDNVSSDITYTYRVRAYVQGQGSSYSNEADFWGIELTVDLPGGATMEMVWIEPGTFTMGSPSSEPGRDSDEGPQHKVTISRGFWLGKVEITQGQWESVMGTTPWSGKSYVQENPSNPAVYISWNDVQTFVAKLNEAEGSEIYRLPTEAEWEYSCRAGTTTRWSFGDDESQLGEYAWYRDNAWNVGEKYAHAVGTKDPNPWGLHDMHGNVYEWVQDWYGSYSSSAQTDPTGPATGSDRVIRGGDFYYYARTVRSANRDSYSPGSRDNYVGARLLRHGQ